MGNVAAVECQESEWPAAGSQRTNLLHVKGKPYVFYPSISLSPYASGPDDDRPFIVLTETKPIAFP